MPNNACSNKPLCQKPMAYYMLFFTLTVFVTVSKLFTSTALHWFNALQCLYHSLIFKKYICVCNKQTSGSVRYRKPQRMFSENLSMYSQN